MFMRNPAGRFKSVLGLYLASAAWIAVAAGGPAAQSLALSEETGHVAGRIVSADTGDALPFANVILFRLASSADSLGTQAGGTFAMAPDGAYKLHAAPGLYRLLVSHVSHEAGQFFGIVVPAGETITLDVALTPTALTSERVEVKAKALKNTNASLLAKQRKAPAVSDAVSSEQMKKTSDSNAAEALQRVTGLSLVGGKYIFVRGLGERYSSTQINGAAVASPEANKKVLELDLIPSALLDNVVVQKTYTPDQPAEFGGGTVDINTQDFPTSKIFSLSIGSGMNSGTTGKGFGTYQGGDRDFFGFDDGTRDLPSSFPKDEKVVKGGVFGGFTGQEMEAFGETFKPIWAPESKTATLPSNINATFGNEVDLFGNPLGFVFGGVFSRNYHSYDHVERLYEPGDTEAELLHAQLDYDATTSTAKTQLGFVVGGVFSRSYQSHDHVERLYEPGDTEADLLHAQLDYDATTSTAKTQLGFVATTGYRLNPSNTVYLRSVYNRVAEDEVRLYEGENHDHGVPQRNTRFKYVERGVFASNVGMSHNLGALNRSTLEWRINYSKATRDEPDRREYIYEFFETGGEPRWQLASRTASMGFTRMFGELDDEETGFEGHLTVPFRFLTSKDSKLKTGFLTTGKDRDAGYRRFAFLNPNGGGIDLTLPPDSLMTPRYIGGTPTSFLLKELTRDTDSYRAEQNVTAGYLMLDFGISSKLRAIGGARVEDWEQRVETFDRFDDAKEPIVADLKETDVLPAVNLVYSVDDQSNVRLAYSRTISRPDLRELTPFSLSDYNSGWDVTGNPDLKRATMQNYDVRVEHFPGFDELVAASAFYKKLKDPIENTIRGGQGRILRPENSPEGHLYGVEIETRVGLDRFATPLGSFKLGANLTIVESEVELSKIGVQTSQKRPLAGQSPYVVNLLLFYAPERSRLAGSLAYNVFGRRLEDVGAFGLPDVYEEPRHSLDATASYAVNGTALKLGVENILNDEVSFEQEGYITREYQMGRNVSLGLSRTF